VTQAGILARVPWTAAQRREVAAATLSPLGLAPHLQIRVDEGASLIPLRFNRAQQKIRAAIGGHRHVLILKARRLGVTTWALAEGFWRAWARPHTECLMIAHRAEDAAEIFRAALTMQEHLPAHLRGARDTDNRHEIRFLHHDPGNGTRNPSALTIGTARGVGVRRGTALQWVHLTEAAFYPDDSEALIAGLLEAAQHGRVMMETTANGARGKFYDLWMENRDGNGPWLPIFAPWWWDETRRLPLTPEARAEFRLTPEEESWAAPHGLTLEQVAWYRARARLLGPRMRSEHPCSDLEAFVVSGRHFFDQAQAVEEARRCPPPIRTAENGGAMIWEEPVPGASYCAGGDPCDGTPGGSRAVLSIHRKDESFRQVAVLRGRWVPREFARLTARWAAYYNHAFVVPERNRIEYARALVHDEGYRHVYRRRSKSGEADREPGFVTDGQTRPYMLDVLKAALEGDGETPPWLVLVDAEFFAETMTFEDEGGGRYAAAPGKRDDTIFAVALALQGRMLGTARIVRFL
jgi:hypothetical protein